MSSFGAWNSASKPQINTYGIDEAFADYHPNFPTNVQPLEVISPKSVPPIDTLKSTAAAEIFGNFCKEKFGFDPVFE